MELEKIHMKSNLKNKKKQKMKLKYKKKQKMKLKYQKNKKRKHLLNKKVILMKTQL